MHESCIYHFIMVTMRRIFVILVLLVFLQVGGTCWSASSDAVLPSLQEEELLALINQARENPLQMAASLGMDPEKILEDLPGLEKILQEGLLPLTFNGNLADAACAHTEDMFAQGYYSNISPDGRDYEERIRESGYPAGASGESLGMILFANFINPENAVRLIFEYMFQDELDPLRTEKRTILDPCLKEVGISVNTGAIILGGAKWNVYLATCDFGAVMSCLEAELLQLINQARENPLQVAASLGIDPEQVLADFPEWHDLLTKGVHPLTFNTTLAEAAREHAADMLAHDYYSHDSLDGRTVEDRIREAGYELLDVGESIDFRPLCNGIDEQEAANLLFKHMLKSELERDLASGERNILNPEFTEVGIAVVTGKITGLGGICGDQVQLVVADFGASQEEARSGIMGVVFLDLDGDGLYSMGEGVGNVSVSVEDMEGTIYHAVTDWTGGFWMELDPGRYVLEFLDASGNLLETRDVAVEDGPIGVRFDMSAAAGLTDEPG
jgi:uncharacterized protein YkwD